MQRNVVYFWRNSEYKLWLIYRMVTGQTVPLSFWLVVIQIHFWLHNIYTEFQIFFDVQVYWATTLYWCCFHGLHASDSHHIVKGAVSAWSIRLPLKFTHKVLLTSILLPRMNCFKWMFVRWGLPTKSQKISF